MPLHGRPSTSKSAMSNTRRPVTATLAVLAIALPFVSGCGPSVESPVAGSADGIERAGAGAEVRPAREVLLDPEAVVSGGIPEGWVVLDAPGPPRSTPPGTCPVR